MRIALLACLLFAGPVIAAEIPAPPASPAPPSTKPATTAPTTPIDVAEKEKLKQMIGQEATIRGKVIDVFLPRSGSVTILNFFEGAARRDFNVVIDKANLEALNAAHNGDLGAAVKGQTILVTGTIADYRGNPQIKLEKPEQLKIEAAKDEKPAEKPAE